MVCPRCGIEMTRVRAGEWKCRNPKCQEHKEKEKEEDKK